MKFYFVQRGDGSVIDIPERDLDSTLKRNPSWKVIDNSEPKKEEKVIPEGFPCPVCEFVAVSRFGLQAHRRSKHK